MRKLLGFVENNLLFMAVATTAFGLAVPSIGIGLEAGISPLLALLMLVISLIQNITGHPKMKKRTVVLSAAAIALVGGLAIAQTMEGMDHSKMGGMGDMGMMSHTSLIPP